MTDKMREGFEARFPVPDGVAWSDETEHYGWVKGTKQAIKAAMTYRALWTGWKEARAAVVIELPEAYENNADGEWLVRRSEVKRIIEAQGLKVKP